MQFQPQSLSNVFTRELIEDCILKSKLFRDMMIDKFIADHSFPTLHEDILEEMNTHYVYQTHSHPYGWYMNKIPFIKALRTMSHGRANEYVKLFPTIVTSQYSRGDMLGLADAKHLVEHYIDNYLVKK